VISVANNDEENYMAFAFNPLTPEFIDDPFPTYHRLQEEDPIHWSKLLDSWVMTRYDNIIAVLRDPSMSAERISPSIDGRASSSQMDLTPLSRMLSMWALFADPPRHTRLRNLFNKAFTQSAIERMREHIQKVVDELLDNVLESGKMDVIRDLAYPLPAIVIAEMIGVPREDISKIKRWSGMLAEFLTSAVKTPEKYMLAQQNIIEAFEYLRNIVASHRANPRDDIMSGLINAEERGDVLSEDELVATSMLLLFAGHETTTNLIGNGILALIRNQDQLRMLQQEPSLIQSAIEELLRYDAPVQAMRRIVLRDTEIEGRQIKKGQFILMVINAANRDPKHFADPDRLDIRRKENRHLAFGFGTHFCIGAPLARLEGQIAIGTLLRRVSDLKLETDRVKWIESFNFRALRELPISFKDY
jgi:cytochrome P450